jgi:LacI family transcriptional regulator
MAKKITLHDIAKEVGVSPTTVSQALSNKGRVSPETIELVRKASERLGYHKKDESVMKTVGLLFSIEQSWAYLWVFIQLFIEKLAKALNNFSINLVIVPIHAEMAPEELLAQLKAIPAKALVTLHLEDEQLLQYLSENGIPILVVMNNKYQNRYLSVCNDDFQGAYDAVKYLIDSGHTRIAYLGTEHPATVEMGNDRLIGTQSAMKDAGLLLQDADVISFRNYHDSASLEQGLKRLMDRENRPTAHYCLHDYLAEKVYTVLLKLGYAIPEDVSIITAGDSFDYSQLEVPQITTMRSQTDQMGTVAADMLNRLLNFHDRSQINMGIKIRQQLVDRGSCRYIRESSDA